MKEDAGLKGNCLVFCVLVAGIAIAFVVKVARAEEV